MTYESCKQVTASTIKSQSSPVAPVVAGALCGLVSWACVRSPSRCDDVRTRDTPLTVSPSQIYPIDSAKSIYQRNCLTHRRGTNVKTPKIQFFNRAMYRGKLIPSPRDDGKVVDETMDQTNAPYPAHQSLTGTGPKKQVWAYPWADLASSTPSSSPRSNSSRPESRSFKIRIIGCGTQSHVRGAVDTFLKKFKNSG